MESNHGIAQKHIPLGELKGNDIRIIGNLSQCPQGCYALCPAWRLGYKALLVALNKQLEQHKYFELLYDYINGMKYYYMYRDEMDNYGFARKNENFPTKTHLSFWSAPIVRDPRAWSPQGPEFFYKHWDANAPITFQHVPVQFHDRLAALPKRHGWIASSSLNFAAIAYTFRTSKDPITMHYKIKDGHPYYLMWHEAAGNCGLSEVGPENNATQLKSKKASKPEDWSVPTDSLEAMRERLVPPGPPVPLASSARPNPYALFDPTHYKDAIKAASNLLSAHDVEHLHSAYHKFPCKMGRINSNIVDAYFHLLSENSDTEHRPTLFAKSSLSQHFADAGTSARFLSDRDARSYFISLVRQLIVVPLHKSDHWSLLVLVNRENERRVEHWDSSAESGRHTQLALNVGQHLTGLLHEEYQQTPHEHPSGHWNDIIITVPQGIIQQTDDADSGVYMLASAKTISSFQPLADTPVKRYIGPQQIEASLNWQRYSANALQRNDVSLLRQWILWELLHGKVFEY